MEALLKKQERYSRYVIRSFDNLKRLGQANTTTGVVEAKLANLEQYWNTFFSGHEELEEIATTDDRKNNYFVNDTYNLTEDGYYTNKGKLLDLARKFATQEEAAPTSQPQPRNQQLPKIALPKFRGEYAEWPSFRDLFSSMVGNNASLTAIEKLLEKEPLALLASVPLTAENLDTAWRTLTDRYENVRLLTTAQISNIWALQPMKSESSVKLKTLYNGTTNAVSALRALDRPVDGYSDFLVYLTVQKLDNQSRREWESSMGVKKDPPTFKELQAFVEARICAIQALEPLNSATSLSSKASSSYSISLKTLSKAFPKVKSHQASGKPIRSQNCSFCQQDHFIVFCDKFRSRSLGERKAFVRKNKLCLNCLGRHFVRECKSPKICKVCNAKHHTMIHGSTPRNSNTQVTSVTEPTSRNEPSRTAGDQVSGLVAHQTRCHTHGSATKILLATAVVHAFTAGGKPTPVRVFLDQGSEASFISELLAQRLRLSRKSASVSISGIGVQSSISSRRRVNLCIGSRIDSQFELTVDALVLPRLTAYAPFQLVTSVDWSHLEGLVLADPDFTSNLRINLLLRADVYSQLLRPGLQNGPLGAPVAQNTNLGWILSGRVVTGDATSTPCFAHQISCDNSLNTALQRFWEQEEIVSSPPLTHEEKECEEHFVSTHSRNSEDRFIVRLPLKTPLDPLGDSRSPAARMLARLEQRFSRDAAFAERYTAFLTEYEDLQHMELVPSALKKLKPSYYLPHHGVVRESSDTTKLRVVFNGSQKTSLEVSLNDCLHVGPPLLPDLVKVILRWRRHAVVFSADMKKMFRQIIIHPHDRDLQRILWRKPSRTTPDTFKLNTVTYGLACAPYLALRVIRQLGLDGRESFPRGAETLLNDVYVDDVLSGADDVASALSV